MVEEQPEQPLVQGVVHLLFIVTQLLEQLFAGAQARDNHLDILIGNVAALA